MKIIFTRNIKTYLSRTIGILFLFLVIINIVIVINFPIYPDEINWRYALSRYLIDGGKYYNYMRGCYPISISIPIYFDLQMRVLSLFSYLKEGIYFRLIPLTIYVFFIFTLYKLLRNIVEDKIKVYKFIILAIVITMANTGFFWSATIRPEIFIVLYIGIYIWKLRKISLDNDSLSFTLLVLFFWAVICLGHPKAIYLLIPNLFLINNIKAKLLTKIILSFFILLYAILVAKFDYLVWINCKQLPEFEAWLMSMNINPMKLLAEPYDFFVDLKNNIVNQILSVFKDAPSKISYVMNPTIGFLPSVRQSNIIGIINFIIKDLYIFNILLAVFLTFKNATSNKIERVYKYGILGLYFYIFLIISLNKTNNNYDVNFWNLVLTFLNIISTAYIFPRINIKRIYIILLVLLMATTTAISYHYYYKKFITTWTVGPLVGPNTPLRFFTSTVQKEIKKDFEENCETDSDLLLSDDATIVALQDYKYILAPITYTALPFYVNSTPEDGKTKLKKFLLQYKKPIFYGACVHQSNLPDTFHVKYNFSKYGICCFSIYE